MNKQDKEERITKIRAMKQSGMTYAKVGEEIGISGQYVAKLLAPSPSKRAELMMKSHGKCADCGKESKSLAAHHDDYGSDPDRMLCKSCHKKADNELGFGNKPHSTYEGAPRQCPVCFSLSGHHRRDCPARGKRSGPVSKAPELKAVTMQISFPPEMAAWLRQRRDSGRDSISHTVQEGVRLVRGW